MYTKLSPNSRRLATQRPGGRASRFLQMEENIRQKSLKT
uniref:Uncharacterized protein n=1 Tax=Anguilla anguilla TaxID=7936 RepID=A0A0E9RRW0_ANGAN